MHFYFSNKKIRNAKCIDSEHFSILQKKSSKGTKMDYLYI
jgi:hypothetical protein